MKECQSGAKLEVSTHCDWCYLLICSDSLLDPSQNHFFFSYPRSFSIIKNDDYIYIQYKGCFGTCSSTQFETGD